MIHLYFRSLLKILDFEPESIDNYQNTRRTIDVFLKVLSGSDFGASRPDGKLRDVA